MRLGKREIDNLSCPPGHRDKFVFDDELTGFGLRLTSTGAKVFIFQYRRGATVRRMPIGRYGDVTPAQARKMAEALRGEVAAGGDPVAKRRATIAAEADALAEKKREKLADELTFARLVDRWEALQLRHRSERYAKEAARALRYSLAAFADLPARSIDAEMARNALDKIPRAPRPTLNVDQSRAEKPPAGPLRGETMARRIRSYARAMYSWARKRGLVPTNPFADIPVESRETPRERFLTDAEIGEVWRASGALGWPWGSYIRFLLLSLQREAETAGLRRLELAPDLSRWDLPGARTKNGRPHLVHLAEAARAILREAPALAGSPLIFTTTGTTPISGFAKAKRRLDAQIIAERAKAAAEAGTEAAPLVAWRLHDFRRTGVTVMARSGVRWEVADRLLNHAQGAIRGVAAVYQRHDFAAERESALNLWAAHVLSVAAGATTANNVVVFHAVGEKSSS